MNIDDAAAVTAAELVLQRQGDASANPAQQQQEQQQQQHGEGSGIGQGSKQAAMRAGQGKAGCKEERQQGVKSFPPVDDVRLGRRLLLHLLRGEAGVRGIRGASAHLMGCFSKVLGASKPAGGAGGQAWEGTAP